MLQRPVVGRTQSSTEFIIPPVHCVISNRNCDGKLKYKLPVPQEGQLVYVQVHQPHWLTVTVRNPKFEHIQAANNVAISLRSRTVGDTLVLVGGSCDSWFVHQYVGAWELTLVPKYL